MTEQQLAALSPAHRDFYQRFCSFWAAPSGARVAEVIAPDATISFTGAGSFSGADYVTIMQGMLDANPGMIVTPLDCAGNGDRLYIAWQTEATIHGARRTYMGVDRFRLKDGRAIEEQVIFDSAVFNP